MSTSVEVPSGKGRGDENFPVGSRLIRPALRPHVHAFYDFARNADDIADDPSLSSDEKLERLDTMGTVLIGDSDEGSPSALRLRDSMDKTGVTPKHSLDLLHAFRQDAVKHRYDTWQELVDYCRYSAMPVGRHVLDLHGESVATYPASDGLCAALQVLNHLQDCARDLAELDRCYLPRDLLEGSSETTEALKATRCSSGIRRVLDEMLDRTEALNSAGAALPGQVRDRRLRVEVAVISGLAYQLARRLRREDPLAQRVKLHRGDVINSVLRAIPRLR